MNKALIVTLFVLLGLFSTSCRLLADSLQATTTTNAPISFAIDDVKAVGQAKNVMVGGEATLPDGTRLAISAIRPLAASENSNNNDNSVYAILDRQFAVVENGRWQADLTLKENDINGGLFESWQLNSDIASGLLKPASQVLFALALEPPEFSENIQQILLDADINNGNTQLSYTAAGEAYLQVTKAVAIQVPSGTVAREKNESTLANYSQAWQNRSDYNPKVDENSDATQIPFTEKDNVSLPASSMLQ